MMYYILLAVLAILVFGPALLADRSPIPETSGNVYKLASAKELDAVLSSHKYVVVDFYADWCPPCRAIAPVFSQLADDHAVKGQLAFAKVNVDHVNDVAGRYQVSAMPTFVFFADGQPKAVDAPGVKASQSVVSATAGMVERIRGADVMALKTVVLALSNKVKPTSDAASGKNGGAGAEE